MRWKTLIKNLDEKQDIVVPGNQEATLAFCVDQFIDIANAAIEQQGYFSVALSGGSTPKAIYERLAKSEIRDRVNWSKVLIFWSDERSVKPSDDQSNYRMAMEALKNLPLKENQIFRMQAEDQIEMHAKAYEEVLLDKIPSKRFDLVMLGMGDDGHTASLFPKTHGLHPQSQLVIANYVPQLDTWRMTLTYKCINAAMYKNIYVLGTSKAQTVHKVLTAPFEPDLYPVQAVGTPEHRALWILDQAAASLLSV